METLWQDLRYAVRMLAKKPGFAAVIILTMALGIGANTAVFSVVNAFLLRPLPYPDADRLVMLHSQNLSVTRGVSFADYLDWHEQAESFDDLAFFNIRWHANVEFNGETETLTSTLTAWNLFSVLQVHPLLGRDFLPEDDQPDHPLAVLLSHGLWQRRLGADPAIVGQRLKIDGSDFIVIGVMPPGFKFPSQTEMWMAAGRWFNRTNRGIRIDQVIARRKSSVTFEQARAEMDTIAARLGAQYPTTNADITIAMTPLRDIYVKDIRASLLLLLGACGFVLLIACANVANLLLARATARRREIAIRAALGARRGRLVRQMLTESTLLALGGGGFGILLALWAVAALAALIPVELPFWVNLNIDWRVLAFTFAVSLVTGLLFGLMPALHSSKLNLNEALKEGGRSAATWASHRVRSLLVTAEVALALVLLIGAGLMIKSLMGLHRTNPGFNPQNVLMIGVNLTADRRQTPEQKADLFRRTLQRIESLPGVESAAANQDLPFVGQMPWDRTSFTIEGQTVDEQQRNPAANVQLVSPAYFNTLGIALISGRVFDERDVINSPDVAIISRQMAQAFWPGEDPIGKRLKSGEADADEAWSTVVGVVGDVKYQSLASAADMDLYYPLLQTAGVKEVHFIARTTGDPKAMAAMLQKEIWAVSPVLGVSRIAPLAELAINTIWQPRLWGVLFGVFSVVALILAVAGIYGVLSYMVSQRAHEIGIRMALGAQRADVMKLILRQGMTLALVGVGIGVVGALLLTRVLAKLLYGVSATDPVTFIIISLALTGVALEACFVPARRATKVDPMVALRGE